MLWLERSVAAVFRGQVSFGFAHSSPPSGTPGTLQETLQITVAHTFCVFVYSCNVTQA